MKKTTQGRRIIAMLKRRALTSMQILQTGISTCWWKRLAETIQDGEALVATKGRDGLNRYRVISATRWTA